MGIRKHRDRAEGRIPKRRMPSKEEINTGTRVHKDKRQEEEELVVGRCGYCTEWSELDDDGICDKCWDQINHPEQFEE